MIKNVIFDLGNVLLRFAPLEYLRTKITDEEKVQQVYEAIFLSEEWLMLDRGVITEGEAVERFVTRHPENADLIRLCMDQWYEILAPIEENIEMLKAIQAKGYKTLILSNFHMSAYENVTSRYDFFEKFDGGVISYRDNVLKPETEIYQKLLTRYNIDACESLFIDDTIVNIKGAAALGFKTILCENSKQLRSALNDWKILE